MTHSHSPAPSAGPESAAQPGAAAPLVKPPPAPGPDASWLQWIADNLLRGCTPESMLETMAAHGLDPARCEAALRDMDRNPGMVAARKWQQLQRKLESVMANQQKLWELAPHYTEVDRREQVSRDEWLERYVSQGRPLLLTGLARDWPALTRWTPQALRDRFGDVEVEIQSERNADPKFEENKLALRRRVPFAEFVDRVVTGGPTNDYYLTANNELLRTPEFASLLDDIGSMPDYCRRSALAGSSWFWFGPRSTNTPLHHDTQMLMHTQIHGRKRWRFISPLETPRLYNTHGVFSPIDVDQPDLVRYPAFREVKMLEVVAEPGDTVFLPLGWWHQVASLDVSISFSFTNLDVPNEYVYVNPAIQDW